MKKTVLSSLIAVACAPALFGATAQAAPKDGAQPNIVYIIVDDQRFDAMGFMNDAAVTPNMDKIAANGVHFKNAFVTTSLSSPSRASVLTGMYAHNHGISDNNPNPVAEKLNYFPQELKKRVTKPVSSVNGILVALRRKQNPVLLASTAG